MTLMMDTEEFNDRMQDELSVVQRLQERIEPHVEDIEVDYASRDTVIFVELDTDSIGQNRVRIDLPHHGEYDILVHDDRGRDTSFRSEGYDMDELEDAVDRVGAIVDDEVEL